MAATSSQVLEREPGKGIQLQLALEDAFADDEDEDEPFEFNSAAVRKHLAEQDYWTATETSPVDEPNTSISTLCLDQSTSQPDPPSVLSPSHTPADHGPSRDLSPEYEPDDLQTDDHPATNHDEEGPVYPTVLIDVSKPPSSRVLVVAQAENDIAVPDDTQNAEPSSPGPSVLDLPALTASSLPSAQTSTPTQQIQRPSRSAGPTIFQKVVSQTRPHFLPPKSRKEDLKHLADWEAMMKQSRAAEEKQRKALQERRLARELRVEQSIHVWEKEITPDWRVVHRDPNLRKLWWRGIPAKLRPLLWERAAGNALTLSKDSYRICLSRAKRALSSGVFPKDTLKAIEDDIVVTLPALHIFHPESGPLYQDLKDLLCAWVVSRADEGLGYIPGISRIAAMILLNMAAPQGFIVLRNLLERHCLRSFYGDGSTKEDVEAYYRIFDTLLADSMPKIYFNFKQHQISPSAYLPRWLAPLFLDHLPFEACARLWDVIMLEGDSFLFRVALAVLAVLEPRLFFPERQELLDLLNGENKAAIEVARRDGVAPNGGKYEIYGVDEETLWDRIESMDEWWRETTWRRLTQRELPDI